MISRVLEFYPQPEMITYLWGGRKTGKTRFLKTTFPKTVYIPFKDPDVLFRYMENPLGRLRAEVAFMKSNTDYRLIIIDDYQLYPEIVKVAHQLVKHENELAIILCGPERLNPIKEKTEDYTSIMFSPLTSCEIPVLDIVGIFNKGLLPSPHTKTRHARASLKTTAYHEMLSDIAGTNRVRKRKIVADLLEALAHAQGYRLNMRKLSRQTNMTRRKIDYYLEQLEQKCFGYLLPSSREQSTPRFYFYDVGIANFWAKRTIGSLKGEAAQLSFEHFLLMEILAYKELTGNTMSLHGWEISKSSYKVSFVLQANSIAVTCNLTEKTTYGDFINLVNFKKYHPHAKLIHVCLDPDPGVIDLKGTLIHVMNTTTFLAELWENGLK